MRGRFTPFVVGVGLLGLAFLNLIFAIYALLIGDPTLGFGWTIALSLVLGGPLTYLGRQDARPARREALIGVSMLWLSLTLVGAVPYVVNGAMGWVDAFFESASGFTATGATALNVFEGFPPSMFMYRAVSQWLGGVGIILLFIAVLPQLAIAGRQLFFAELPGPTEEKLTPKLRQTASAVLFVYLSLTLLCTLAYRGAGMRWFDALAHTFTTVSAAGFSPYANSFENFDAPVEWVAIAFMFFAGISFALYQRLLQGRVWLFWRDVELRAYVAIIGVVSALVAVALLEIYEPLEALRYGLFQVLSILTTTGYASADFAAWPERTQALLVLLMFVGGSAGSAAGGVKIVRWLMIGQSTVREIRRTLHPRVVMPIYLGRVTIPEEVVRAVSSFIALFFGLVGFSTLVLAWLGADLITAFTASVACLGNVGPGLGGVGPMSDFSHLHPVSRVLLSVMMIAGRLELLTMLVIFDRRFWLLPRGVPGRR